MFDKSTEILAIVRERLRSPLLGSFFLAFWITNWRVLVCLFWFDQDDLSHFNVHTHVEYIELVTTWSTLLFYPVLVSLAYTFGWPFLRNKIDQFTVAREIAGQALQRPILGKAVFTAEQYLEKREALDEKQKELELSLEESKKYELENQALLEQIEALEQKVENFKQRYDTRVLNGVWHRQVVDGSNDKPITKIKIADSYYSRYGSQGSPEGSSRIEYFEADFDRPNAEFKFRIYSGTAHTSGNLLVPTYTEIVIHESPNISTLRGYEIHHSGETPQRVEIIMDRVGNNS